MPFRFGPGPVFGVELVAASRRWQSYALRALVVFIILAALGLVILNYHDDWMFRINQPTMSLGDYARVGSIFVNTVLGTQLALILLVAPAATAGAICIDKARGNLTLLMTTDMSVAEIVIGKLLARLLPVLILIGTSLPVLFIIMMMGGVNYDQLILGFMVLVGCAVFCCALALWLSVYVGKTQEALLLAYFVIMIWLVTYPVVGYLAFWPAAVPIPQVALLNPYVMLFEPSQPQFGATLFDYQVFMAATCGVAGLFVLLAIWRLRIVVLRQHNRPRRSKRKGKHRSYSRMLNQNALRWYERHRRRPTGAGRVIWTGYIIMALAGLAYVHGHAWLIGTWAEIPSLISCGIVGMGLLLATVHAVTALSDERTRGSLDILLLTPVPTRAILWAKWRSAFGVVIRLAMIPLAIGLSVYAWSDFIKRPAWWMPHTAYDRSTTFQALIAIVLIVLSAGALFTSVGLLFATWMKNLGRAVGMAIGFYVLLTVIWPIVVRMVFPRFFGQTEISLLSPAYAVGYATDQLERSYMWQGDSDWFFAFLYACGFNVIFAAFAYALALIAFDRKMGRISRDKPVAIKDRTIWMKPVFGRKLRDVVE